MSDDYENVAHNASTNATNTVERRVGCFGSLKLAAGKFFSFQSKRQALEFSFFVGMVGTLFLAITVPLIIFSLVDSGIDDQVVIDSTSAPNYASWQSNVNNEDLKITYDLYYFDIQNPIEILNGAQPVVTQVGPYSFREYYNKFDIRWSDDGDTVTYNTQRYYLFDEEQSNPGLSLSDKILLPYPTVIGFEYLISQIPAPISDLVNLLINEKINSVYGSIEHNITDIYNSASTKAEQNLIISLNNTINSVYQRIYHFADVSKPADLLLKLLLCNVSSGMSPFWETDPFSAWFGWLQDPLLMEVQRIIEKLNIDYPWSTAVPGASVNWTTIEDTRRRRAPDTLKTGKKNAKEVAKYVKYGNMQSFWSCINPMAKQNTSEYTEGSEFPACPIYQSDWTAKEAEENGYVQPFATDFANRIEGSDGNMFGRPVTTEKLQVFVNDIYRSLFLIHTEDTQDWAGVTLRRYELQSKDLLNSSVNPNNAQYYNFGPSGLENATKAANIPLFISFPHFLSADNSLISAVKGLSPDPKVHKTYLDIEPQTGLLARGAKKLQINYLMESKTLPSVEADAVTFSFLLCANISDTIKRINKLRRPKDRLPIPPCNLTELTALLTCLQTPSTWDMQNGQIYFPYGWASEAVNLPESDGTDLQTALFSAEDFANAFRFWCLILSCASFFVLTVLLIDDYTRRLSDMRISGWSHSLSSLGSSGSGGAGQRRPPSAPTWQASEPLLQGQGMPTWNSPTKSGFSFSS